MNKALNVDTEMLIKKIDESGLKKGYIVEKLGLSRYGFDKKVNGTTPFRVPEVFVLCTLLSINDDERSKIFYPKEQP